MLEFSSQSIEYVPVQVTALKEGLSYNPTGDVVAMAFSPGVATTTPSNLTFNTATWDTSGTAYYALGLIGPGQTATLTAGIWSVWVQVTDNPEVPVKLAGQIQVF